MVSHHDRAIFVHVPKVAGQSVEHVFLKRLGLSWENRAPLLLRYNDRPELGPQSLAHLTAPQYVDCKYVTEEQWETYFKFSFVRNPYSRAVSIWKYAQFAEEITFADFVRTELGGAYWEREYWFVRPQTDFTHVNGEAAVDFIGRFENLKADWATVCLRLGIEDQSLPHANVSKPAVRSALGKLRRSLRPKIERFADWREHYDEDSKRIVAERYADDLRTFGYDFPDD